MGLGDSQGAADDQNKADSVPSMFCCPICYEAMSDPVVLVTGHTYDRDCITRWIGNGHKTCPVTGVRLRHLELMPNFALRNAVRVRPQTRLASLTCCTCTAARCDT
jgi:F-box/WD-40 domain protein 7